MKLHTRTQSESSPQRRAAVTVEMAVTLPVLFLFFFSQFELVRLNNIRNSVYFAAYEGAREGLIPGATAADVNGKVNHILSSVGAVNGTVIGNGAPGILWKAVDELFQASKK